MRAIELLGRDWPELGPLALVELDGGGALALSRGALPKRYEHKDPNEDAALLVRLPEGVLLAVADGFNGFDAAALAIERACALAEPLVLASGAAFRAGVCALLDDVQTRLPAGSESRACLVLAVLRGASCELASFGDAFAFRAGSPLPLMQQNTILVGSGHSPRALDPARWHTSFARAARADRAGLRRRDQLHARSLRDPGRARGLRERPRMRARAGAGRAARRRRRQRRRGRVCGRRRPVRASAREFRWRSR